MAAPEVTWAESSAAAPEEGSGETGGGRGDVLTAAQDRHALHHARSPFPSSKIDSVRDMSHAVDSGCDGLLCVQVDAWREMGFCVIEGLFPAAAVVAVAAVLEGAYPAADQVGYPGSCASACLYSFLSLELCAVRCGPRALC